MTKISRYILVIIAILTASVVLPELFWTAFDKPVKVPYVQYSCMINDFTIFNSSEKTRKDTKGNSYTRDEYEMLLPLLYTRQLIVDERLPDTILGEETDIRKYSKARSFKRIKPSDFQSPQPQLYPLFESESGRANLQLPNDLFRISWRLEFINAENNTIDEEKSRMFSAALYQKGFQFPAKQISGIATTRKSCDEGYFVVDSEDQLFHLKMIKGQPYIKKVELPEGLSFKYICCTDFKNKLFYAYLIGNDNGIYILTQNEYQLIRWPIEDYIPEDDDLKIQSDYFNYNVTIRSQSKQKSYALDKDYKLVDTYEFDWIPNEECTVGKISTSIFPFAFSLKKSNSRYIRFYPQIPKGFLWIIVNLLFVGCQLLLIKKRRTKFFNQILDLIIISATGLFGFIAVNIFPNKLD